MDENILSLNSKNKYERPSNEQSMPHEEIVQKIESEQNRNEYDSFVEEEDRDQEEVSLQQSTNKHISESSDHEKENKNIIEEVIDHERMTSNNSELNEELVQERSEIEKALNDQESDLEEAWQSSDEELEISSSKNIPKKSLKEDTSAPEIKSDSQVIQTEDHQKLIRNNETLIIEDWESEEKDKSDSETIALNSDSEEPEYFKSIAKCQEGQSSSNFLIKLQVQNK